MVLGVGQGFIIVETQGNMWRYFYVSQLKKKTFLVSVECATKYLIVPRKNYPAANVSSAVWELDFLFSTFFQYIISQDFPTLGKIGLLPHFSIPLISLNLGWFSSSVYILPLC